MTKKERLLDCFRLAKENGMSYMIILSQSPTEIRYTVLQNKDFENKSIYYKKNYNKNLHHKRNKNITIIDFCFGEVLDDMLQDLFCYDITID